MAKAWNDNPLLTAFRVNSLAGLLDHEPRTVKYHVRSTCEISCAECETIDNNGGVHFGKTAVARCSWGQRACSRWGTGHRSRCGTPSECCPRTPSWLPRTRRTPAPSLRAVHRDGLCQKAPQVDGQEGSSLNDARAGLQPRRRGPARMRERVA